MSKFKRYPIVIQKAKKPVTQTKKPVDADLVYNGAILRYCEIKKINNTLKTTQRLSFYPKSVMRIKDEE
jgi:hypothetical protein